jgi:predicted enzyme related to lactoylglutathione lyase
MYIVNGYPDGIFGWLDVTSADFAAAKAFYGGLFGWEIVDLDDGEGNIIYHEARIGGERVAGVGEPFPGGDPIPVAYWTPYVIHRDADGVAARAEAAGGTIVVPPMDVMAHGRMTIIQDPTGAMFGVWQPGTHSGARIVNSPNSLIWNELQTPDVAAAAAFFEAVFGWSSNRGEDGNVTFETDGRGHAMASKAPDGAWPAWLNYFLVDDADATIARAKALGGSVVEGSFGKDEWGTMAVLVDPQGGVFGIMESSYGAPEPPSV